jgi:hypothetical protein
MSLSAVKAEDQQAVTDGTSSIFVGISSEAMRFAGLLDSSTRKRTVEGEVLEFGADSDGHQQLDSYRFRLSPR